jgi:hypothetical protein
MIFNPHERFKIRATNSSEASGRLKAINQSAATPRPPMSWKVTSRARGKRIERELNFALVLFLQSIPSIKFKRVVAIWSLRKDDVGRPATGQDSVTSIWLSPDFQVPAYCRKKRTMLLGFTPLDRARPGAGHTLKTGFGRGGRLFGYPNGGVTMHTCALN